MIQITPLEPAYLEEIILLSNQVFGEGFLNRDYVNQYVGLRDKFGFVATEKDKFVGYILMDKLTPSALIKSILEEKDWFEETTKDQKVIFLIKQIAVCSSQQNKGVGNQLIKESLRFIAKNQGMTYCLGWRKGKTVPIENIMLRNGFAHTKTIHDYWRKDSIHKKYSCNHCGAPPCTCIAEVYIKKKAFK